jgi:hypothetical protein
MMQSEVREALNEGRRIFFVDETMFTTATVLIHACVQLQEEEHRDRPIFYEQ